MQVELNAKMLPSEFKAKATNIKKQLYEHYVVLRDAMKFRDYVVEVVSSLCDQIPVFDIMGNSLLTIKVLLAACRLVDRSKHPKHQISYFLQQM